MATLTIGLTGGNYDSIPTWTEAAVPTSADDVGATGTSGNLTVNVASAARSFDMTSYVGTLTRNSFTTLAIGDGTAGAGNVAMKLVAGMTYTESGTVGAITFASTSATQQTIATAGKSIFSLTLNGVGGSWVLSDALALTNNLTLTNGAFATGNQAISCLRLLSSTSNVRTLALGSSTITITDVSGTLWSLVTTNLTFDAGTSTIVLADAGAGSKTFAGGGATYNIVSITTGGAGAWTFTGSNTFAQLTTTGGGTKTIKFTLGTTTTLTGGESSFFSGAAGNLITLGSSTPGSAWTLSIASNKSSDYLSVSDCTVSGGGKLYCGANSTDGGGNNANVVFTAPPGPGKPKNVAHMARMMGAT